MLHLSALAPFIGVVDARQVPAVVRRRQERGRFHAEGLEDAARQERVEGLTGRDLDDARQHVKLAQDLGLEVNPEFLKVLAKPGQ